MHPRTILLTSLILGTALGLSITWADFGHAPSRLLPEVARPSASSENGDQPLLEIDSLSHDFGKVEQGTTVRHAFVFSNRGTGVLQLTAGATTCSACTIAALERSEVPPGESTNVTVEYKTNGKHPKFRQTATILTNDLRRSRVELTISGLATSKYDVIPWPVNLGNVAAGDSAAATAVVRYFLPGELRVTDYKFDNAPTASLFELQTVPLTPDEARHEEAQSGYKLMLSLKPGLPLGAFHQTIRLTIEMNPGATRAEVLVPITGTVVSDLSLVGPGWRSDENVLALGTVDSSKGTTRKLNLLARGPTRSQVELQVAGVDPPQVRVNVGERTPLNGSVDQIPLEVVIPPGLSPTVRQGTTQGPYGEAILSVKNHSSVKEIRLKLKFVIE